MVIGRGQAGVAGRGPILNAVDEPLGVFDPEAHGERLGLHRHAGPAQHPKGIPGAVAYGEDENGCRDSDLFIQDGSADMPFLDFQSRQSGLKAVFRSPFLKVFSEGQNEAAETVGAQMRFLKV
jgi:hypothetical protein